MRNRKTKPFPSAKLKSIKKKREELEFEIENVPEQERGRLRKKLSLAESAYNAELERLDK